MYVPGYNYDTATYEYTAIYMVSNDAGATWSEVTIAGPMANPLICYSMSVALTDPSIMYAFGYWIDYGTYTYYPTVWKSTDGGATWAEVPNDLATLGYYYLINGWVSPEDSNHLIVSGYNPAASSVAVSTDGGATWTPSGTFSSYAEDFAYNPGTDTVYMAIYTQGVQESADGGLNWTDMGLTATATGLEIDCKDGVLFASTRGLGTCRLTGIPTALDLDVKANEMDSGVVVNAGDDALVTVNVAAGPLMDTGHDVWVLVRTGTGGKYSYGYGPDGRFRQGWCTEYFTGQLPNISDVVIDGSIPVGSYQVFLGLDSIPNGNLNIPYVVDYDMVDITVVP